MTGSVAFRFACDDHCGRLARWLRTVGFDCTHDQTIENARLLDLALREDRIILTRDRRLARMTLARAVILLESPDPLRQLVQVLTVTGGAVSQQRLFTRCAVCNHPTEPAEIDAVATRIPPYVRKTQTSFRTCRMCGRVFWRGTHVERMLARLRVAGLISGAAKDPRG